MQGLFLFYGFILFLLESLRPILPSVPEAKLAFLAVAKI